jgi:hypothetical protein
MIEALSAFPCLGRLFMAICHSPEARTLHPVTEVSMQKPLHQVMVMVRVVDDSPAAGMVALQ